MYNIHPSLPPLPPLPPSPPLPSSLPPSLPSPLPPSLPTLPLPPSKQIHCPFQPKQSYSSLLTSTHKPGLARPPLVISENAIRNG